MKIRYPTPPKKLSADRTYKIGCYYFPGWGTPCGGISDGGNSADAWNYIPTGERPLKGAYNENLASVCDAQLEEMKVFGISFVVVDWYQRSSAAYMDHWIKNALASTVLNKPKICAMYTIPSSSPVSVAGFRAAYAIWQTYINNPAYFTIDGKPVVFIYVADSFKTLAGGSTSQVLELLNEARLSGNFYFVGMGFSSTHFGNGPDSLKAAGYDATSYYNLPTMNPNTWDGLESNYTDYYSRLESASVPSILPISTGFDTTNWGGAFRNTLNTLPQFEAHLRKAKAYLDYSYDKNNGMAIIEAWNEYGEGGVLEPANHNGGLARGLKVKEVFGL